MKRANRILALASAALLAHGVSPAFADSGVVGIITGMPGGTYAATAGDLMILDDPHIPLRVIPMDGKGSLQNLDDILHLRGVDVGFVQGDALVFAKEHNLFPANDLANIDYIAKLYDEEIHVIARSTITSMADLQGKKINVDVARSGSAMTAEILLSALGINAQVSNQPQAQGVQALKNGEIDAIIHVGGAPIPLLADIPAGTLHFLPVDLANGLDRTYLPAQLTHDEYPTLIPAGSPPVDTIAVSDVMAVFNWPKASARYTNVAKFVDALFDHISELQKPPHHPKWREVNLAAKAPGWQQFPAAQEYVNRTVQANGLGQVAAKDGLRLTEDQKRELFRQYQAWQRSQGH